VSGAPDSPPAGTPGTISVIVATRDRPEMVLRCVASIVAAAGKSLGEIVVVDQSTGPAADLATVVGPREGRAFVVRHLKTETVGVSRNRNFGFAAAGHPIVAVTDDDCVVAPDWIAAIARAFDERPELTAVCGRILPLGKPVPGAAPAAVVPYTEAVDLPPDDDPSRYGAGGNFAVRREAVLAAGGYDEHLGPGTPVPSAEDAELIYRLLKAGSTVAYDPRILVRHESWRPPMELLDIAYAYELGAGVYLTRELVARHDTVAARALLRRFFRDGAWLFLGGLVLRKPWHWRAAWRRMAGLSRGVWAVLRRDPDYGITREWLHTPPAWEATDAGRWR